MTLVPVNRVLCGDCVELMRRMPAESVDLVLTDPPYLARYRDRAGREVAGDDDGRWLGPAFAEVSRVLKPHRFCVSFYGWHRVDDFMAAWRRSGLRPVGHLVFVKEYPSRQGFTRAHHEQAYLLAKGDPARPSAAPPDVLQFTYTGNRLHPTEKPVRLFSELVAAFSEPGDLVLDPFAGSGTTAVAARALGRRFIAMELDPRHCRTARERLGQ